MPKVKRFLPFNHAWYLRKRVNTKLLRKKVFTLVFTFGCIYLFSNRVITHFVSNFIKISSDFADLE